MPEIGLKVDIDTYRGMKEGLPRLLALFKREGVRASVFVSYGPDQSGRAVKRIFTKKGFLKKMLRTNAAKLYGFKTMLYGTLLPAPQIGTAFPDLVKQTRAEGHDVGVHAWSHVLWQDDLDSLSAERIRAELSNAWEAHRKILGENPSAFAAPAWKINETALAELARFQWKYLSIGRGPAPIMPRIGDVAPNCPELPSSLPTLDEILAWDGMTQEGALAWMLREAQKQDYCVYTLHTEAEGLACYDFFEKFLCGLKERGFTFKTLLEKAGAMKANPPQLKEIKQGELPGRAGLVAVV